MQEDYYSPLATIPWYLPRLISGRKSSGVRGVQFIYRGHGENIMRFFLIILLGLIFGFMFRLTQESSIADSYIIGFIFSVVASLDLVVNRLDEILKELKNK